MLLPDALELLGSRERCACFDAKLFELLQLEWCGVAFTRRKVYGKTLRLSGRGDFVDAGLVGVCKTERVV